MHVIRKNIKEKPLQYTKPTLKGFDIELCDERISESSSIMDLGLVLSEKVLGSFKVDLVSDK